MGTKHDRLPREHYQGRVCVAFTLCIEARRRLFIEENLVQVFTNFLQQVAEKHDFRAIYCFMPDHLHQISLGLSEDSDVLSGVEEFKQMTNYWLKANNLGVRWQKSFFDRIIRARELGIMVRYVLSNPIRRGLVTDWREYPFIGSIGMDLETFLEELHPD